MKHILKQVLHTLDMPFLEPERFATQIPYRVHQLEHMPCRLFYLYERRILKPHQFQLQDRLQHEQC